METTHFISDLAQKRPLQDPSRASGQKPGFITLNYSAAPPTVKKSLLKTAFFSFRAKRHRLIPAEISPMNPVQVRIK
jgi:hypothetical protein